MGRQNVIPAKAGIQFFRGFPGPPPSRGWRWVARAAFV